MTDGRDDAFERIVDQALPADERTEMIASARRYAPLETILTSTIYEHGRWHPSADEHPEALRATVDPTIRLMDVDEPESVWRLPAGWVEIVNPLHARLLDELGNYKVREAGQRSGGLRFRTSPVARGTAADLIAAARAESLRVCEVCGGPSAPSPLPHFDTRCARHPVGRPDRVPGAISRPPGWEREGGELGS